MSYYFAIINTRDKPLFEVEFGTSKQGGDGAALFSAEARKMNPFIVHAALDYVDELQWSNNAMYVQQSHISSPSSDTEQVPQTCRPFCQLPYLHLSNSNVNPLYATTPAPSPEPVSSKSRRWPHHISSICPLHIRPYCLESVFYIILKDQLI